SEAIRDLMRENIVEQAVEAGGEVAGTITIIYDHHTRDLSDKLTSLQHDYYTNIVSTTHVHMDHHNCLEVLVVKGKSKDVQTFADKLISTKGVTHGKLVMTSTGKGLK
ncbi:MAG: nickel-responsive transcriptional regulator NikR, partial [bacterium]